MNPDALEAWNMLTEHGRRVYPRPGLLFSVFILLTCLAFGVELLFDSYENSLK